MEDGNIVIDNSEDNTELLNTYIRKMKETLDDIQGQNLILQAKLHILDKNYADLSKKYSDLFLENEENKSSLAKITEISKEQEQEIKNWISKNDELSTQLVGLRSDKDVIQADLNNYTHVLNQKITENGELLEQIRVLKQKRPGRK